MEVREVHRLDEVMTSSFRINTHYKNRPPAWIHSGYARKAGQTALPDSGYQFPAGFIFPAQGGLAKRNLNKS